MNGLQIDPTLLEGFSINLSKILQEFSDSCEIEKNISFQCLEEIYSSENFKNIAVNLSQKEEMIQIYEIFLAQVIKIFTFSVISKT